MPDEYEYEEFADMAIGELRSFIDTENHFLSAEHHFKDAIASWQAILAHLVEDGRISDEEAHLYELSADVSEKIVEIEALVREGELRDLRLKKEEEEVLKKVEADAKHRDWRAVKGEIEQETRIEKEVLRLQAAELHKLREIFTELRKIIREGLKPAKKEIDATAGKEFEKLKKSANYYFLQIYATVKSYSKVFRHLWKKEKALAGRIK